MTVRWPVIPFFVVRCSSSRSSLSVVHADVPSDPFPFQSHQSVVVPAPRPGNPDAPYCPGRNRGARPCEAQRLGPEDAAARCRRAARRTSRDSPAAASDSTNTIPALPQSGAPPVGGTARRSSAGSPRRLRIVIRSQVPRPPLPMPVRRRNTIVRRVGRPRGVGVAADDVRRVRQRRTGRRTGRERRGLEDVDARRLRSRRSARTTAVRAPGSTRGWRSRTSVVFVRFCSDAPLMLLKKRSSLPPVSFAV